jgi:hypothetical protein
MDSYPYLRQVLAPEYAVLPVATLEAFMDERFGEGSAQQHDEMLEGFFDDLGRTLAKVAPAIGNVAGGVARGAMAGSSLSVPGIIAGAVMGGAGTALSSYGTGTLRDVGRALDSGVNIAGQFSPMGRLGQTVGSAISGVSKGGFTSRAFAQQGGQLLSAGLGQLTGGGGGAAGQLAGLLQRPEFQQALAALQLGSAGRRHVNVGSAQTPVPTTAIAGLLQSLVAQTIDEAAGESDGAESDLAYMTDAKGSLVGDPSLGDDRSQRVLALLDQAQRERLLSAAWEYARRHGGHADDCPWCARGAHPRSAHPRSEDLYDGVEEAFDESLDEFDGEDYGEALSEAIVANVNHGFEDDLGEDLSEDYGEDLSEAVLDESLWEADDVFA